MAGAWRPAVVAMIGVLFVYGLRLPTAAVAAAVVIRAIKARRRIRRWRRLFRPSTLGFRAAISMLREIVTRQPDNADAYNWLAYATRKSGDPARSIPIYEKALALDPKHLGAHEYIGEAYLALDDLPKARSTWRA